jgi:hypothetical protein
MLNGYQRGGAGDRAAEHACDAPDSGACGKSLGRWFPKHVVASAETSLRAPFAQLAE